MNQRAAQKLPRKTCRTKHTKSVKLIPDAPCGRFLIVKKEGAGSAGRPLNFVRAEDSGNRPAARGTPTASGARRA
ncbi:hypothetical protein BHK98_09460 [Hornefia porci]|uniref:Uncharacterized protein n=1 Tax=Hornefia porci TaxID=2652292 RepID=A0A1Q9JJ74_9FIRM|nr:hypothetical protein BHK98_09460 [Hornefia porci]